MIIKKILIKSRVWKIRWKKTRRKNEGKEKQKKREKRLLTSSGFLFKSASDVLNLIH